MVKMHCVQRAKTIIIVRYVNMKILINYQLKCPIISSQYLGSLYGASADANQYSSIEFGPETQIVVFFPPVFFTLVRLSFLISCWISQ